MGTRSRIAIRNADGTFDSIYCHWDGYPSGVGLTLRDHYTTTEKVRQLIDLGDISSLGAEIGSDETTAYGRDRGETGIEAIRGTEPLEALAALTQDCGGEWMYVWDGHSWSCAEVNTGNL